MDFKKANNTVHPVETQWHFPILTAAGFQPVTKEQTGLVRKYIYTHPDGREIVCTTGYSSDYWTSKDGKRGFWSDLEKHVCG